MVKRELEEHAAATISIASRHLGIYVGIAIISILAVVGAFTVLTWLF